MASSGTCFMNRYCPSKVHLRFLSYTLGPLTLIHNHHLLQFESQIPPFFYNIKSHHLVEQGWSTTYTCQQPTWMRLEMTSSWMTGTNSWKGWALVWPGLGRDCKCSMLWGQHYIYICVCVRVKCKILIS